MAKVKTVTVSVAITAQIAQFESVRYEFTEEHELESGDDPDEVRRDARKRLEKDAQKRYDAVKEANKEKSK